MSSVLVGIDVGSTVLKVAAFDSRTGRALAQHAERLKLSILPNGGREESPRGLDRALSRGMRALETTLGSRWKTVEGVGLAAQGGSAIIADRRTGKALTPMLMWSDARTESQLKFVKEMRSGRFWRTRTWRDVPGHGLAKMLWLRSENPDYFSDRCIYVGAGEYAYFGLTGVWRQDACNALQIGCFNVPKQALDSRLLGLIDVPLSSVAPLRKGHEYHPLSAKAARRFHLRAGIPVAGPYMDHEAGYLSTAGISERPLQCSLGTAWVGNFQLPPARTRWSSLHQLVIPAVLGKGWLVIQPLLTGNMAWDWGLRTFLHRDHSKALAMVESVFEKSLLPRDDRPAMPWMETSHGFTGIVPGEGSFPGSDPSQEPDDRLRALAASMVFEMGRIFAVVKTRKKVDSVVLGGGASKGTFFCRLFAGLFAPLPVFTLKEPDLSGARGSLWALNTKVAKAGARKVRCPAKGLTQDIRNRYKLHRKAFHDLYGDPSAYGAIQFD